MSIGIRVPEHERVVGCSKIHCHVDDGAVVTSNRILLIARLRNEEPMTTREIAAVVSAIIALVALFRPEWSILLRRWTSRLRLTTLPRLEVGFGYFGATIALVGTLRTLNHDQFIEEMRARVI